MMKSPAEKLSLGVVRYAEELLPVASPFAKVHEALVQLAGKPLAKSSTGIPAGFTQPVTVNVASGISVALTVIREERAPALAVNIVIVTS